MTRFKSSFTALIKPRPPWNYRLTIRKPAGWALFAQHEVFEKGKLWTALHVGSRLVGVKLENAGTTKAPRVKVKFFSQKPLATRERSRVTQALSEKIGAFEDLSEFYKMALKDSILKHAAKDLFGMHETDFETLFAAGILSICLQMAPTKRSEEMMDCVVKNYGDLAEFDGKKVLAWPKPATIAKLDPHKFAKQCKLGYRAKYLVQMAQLLEKGFPELEDLKRMTPEQAKAVLLELPGVGDYSADIMNPHGGFPIDVWSADIFGKLFFGREPKNGRVAIDRIKREGLRRWGSWAWLAFVYVVHDLESLSKKLRTTLRMY